MQRPSLTHDRSRRGCPQGVACAARLLCCSGVAFMATTGAHLFAQGYGHVDVQFGYADGRIQLNQQVYTHVFPKSGISRQFTANPGFGSERDIGLGIGPNDEILYHVLDDLVYWNGTGFAEPDRETQIRIQHNPASVPETVVGLDTGPQSGSVKPPRNRIGSATANGDFHSHVQFLLEPYQSGVQPPPPEFGAYGLKISLATSHSGIEPSAPAFLVFNFGLAEAVFQAGVQAFAELLQAGGVQGDFNGNGSLDAADIDALSAAVRNSSPDLRFDLNGNGTVEPEDRTVWVQQLKRSYLGDADLDGEFTSNDLVAVFQQGEYEDLVALNSTWADGDWTGDQEFDSADFVLAFAGGGFEMGPRAATSSVPEPASLLLLMMGAGYRLTTRQRRELGPSHELSNGARPRATWRLINESLFSVCPRNLGNSTMTRPWTSICLTTCFVLISAMVASAQHDHGHSDVRFRYTDGRIVVEPGPEGYVLESEFELEGVDRQFTTNPGFNSEVEEGLGIGAGDTLVYNLLDNLYYWNESFRPVPEGVQIRIVNNPPAPIVPDTLVSASSGIQAGSFQPVQNRINSAEDNGDFHSHVNFYLEPNLAPESAAEAMFGAYGIKMSLTTDAADVADSDPFFVVFNFGLDEARFEQGVAAYAALVPEPTGASLVVIAGLTVAAWGRRRTTLRAHRSRSRMAPLRLAVSKQERLKSRSARSQGNVTTVACDGRSRATHSAAATLRPERVPTSRPKLRCCRRVTGIASAAPVSTVAPSGALHSNGGTRPGPAAPSIPKQQRQPSDRTGDGPMGRSASPSSRSIRHQCHRRHPRMTRPPSSWVQASMREHGPVGPAQPQSCPPWRQSAGS